MKKKQVMESRELKINVASTLIRLRNNSFTLQSALLELIDNSIDAGAKRVSIRQIDGALLIEDDGEGFDDIFRAFDIGESRKVGQIGRYGVGLKDASIKYSTKTTISSRGKSASCDWDAAIESGSAEIVKCQCLSDLTVVQWEGFETLYGNAIQTQEIRRCYALALGRDLSIEVNGEKLLPTPEPSFAETINETFNYEDKRVRLSGGVFSPSDENRKSWSGYNIYYQGRLIGPGRITTMGMGMGDVSCSNFSFKVEIDDDDERWVLATNKDSVEGASELLDYIFHTYTRAMLKTAERQAIDIELRDVISAVESACSVTGNITRKPRTNKDTRGETKRQGRPKMNTFSPDSDGGYSAEHLGKGTQGGIRLLFVDLKSETLGEVSIQGRLLVSLNKSNKFIADNISNIPVMKAVAVIIYAMHKAGGGKGMELFDSVVIDSALQIAGQNLSRESED
jgi:hypothetical protein